MPLRHLCAGCDRMGWMDRMKMDGGVSVGSCKWWYFIFIIVVLVVINVFTVLVVNIIATM
jgi:hypothetical protein